MKRVEVRLSRVPVLAVNRFLELQNSVDDDGRLVGEEEEPEHGVGHDKKTEERGGNER